MKGDSPEYERRDLKFKGTQIFFESTKMDLRREKVEPLKAQKFLIGPRAVTSRPCKKISRPCKNISWSRSDASGPQNKTSKTAR